MLSAKEAYFDIIRQTKDSLENATSSADREELRLIRSAARSLLPNDTRTAISVSATARSLRHFLELRGALVGDIEMRLLSAEIYEMLLVEAPSFIQDFEKSSCEQGLPLVTKV